MSRARANDAATLARAIHLPQAGPRGQECSVKVDGQYLLPVAIRQVVDGPNDLVAGVAAQYIHAPNSPEPWLRQLIPLPLHR